MAILTKDEFKSISEKMSETKPYTIHQELNPKFWDSEGNLNKDVRISLLKIVRDVLKGMSEDFKKDIRPTEILFLGSNTGYNYTPISDVDTHIILNFEKLGDPLLVKQFLDSKKNIWNLKHDIMVKGHEVELYFQNISETNASAGSYSLATGQWIKKPEPLEEPKVDTVKINEKVKDLTNTIKLLERGIQTENISNQRASVIYNKATELKTKLRLMRQEGLKRDGEFAEENLIFKTLRNNGVLEILDTVYNSSFDKIYQVEQLEENIK